MKAIIRILFINCFLFITQSQAQSGQWTWMRGDSIVNGSSGTFTTGNYGSINVPDINNEPPSRYHCTYWTDTSGNFWIFGGTIGGTITGSNDLWKYEPAGNIWTWMKGPQLNTNTAGVFGTQGIPSANNFPPVLFTTGIAWTDKNNNLWLFHKFGDLWKYDISSNEWTWIKGSGVPSQPAVYGTQGVPSPANTPGAHNENKAGWTDSSNNLWYYSEGDIWRYAISSNEWTWLKGNGAGIPVAVYGIMGVPDPNNQPDLKNSFNYWKDKYDNFYINFYNNPANTSLAMWKYNSHCNMWSWENGIQLAGANSGKVFISQCVASSGRSPGKRAESRGGNFISKNAQDVFWFSAGLAIGQGQQNDIWVYKPKQKTWTWISGDSVFNNPGNYGSKGVMTASNMLSCRNGQAMWVDKNQQVWIFGGSVNGTGNFGNDLWRFTPDSNCAGLLAEAPAFVITDTNLCNGESTVLFADTNYIISIAPLGGFTFNADSSVVTFQPSATTTYTVSGSQNTVCPPETQLIFTIHVDDFNLPVFNDTSVCPGIFVTLTLDTAYQFTFLPADSVVYTPGGNSVTFNNTVSTTYTISATKNGCPINGFVYLTISKVLPLADFTITPALITQSFPDINLTNQSQFADHYEWYLGTQFLGNTTNHVYTASDTGRFCFTLIAINNTGCRDSVTHCADVAADGHSTIFMPNSFSPNEDGINDYFHIKGSNIQLLNFKIYNRWGQNVFSTKDINAGWNGMYKNEKLAQDVYYYYVEYKDFNGKKYLKKGDITLVR